MHNVIGEDMSYEESNPSCPSNEIVNEDSQRERAKSELEILECFLRYLQVEFGNFESSGFGSASSLCLSIKTKSKF